MALLPFIIAALIIAALAFYLFKAAKADFSTETNKPRKVFIAIFIFSVLASIFIIPRSVGATLGAFDDDFAIAFIIAYVIHFLFFTLFLFMILRISYRIIDKLLLKES